jgi:SEFIR domain
MKFANVLRDNGVDAVIDQYDDNYVGRDWSGWGPSEISSSDLVICLGSPLFKARWSAVSGSGVANEARAVRAKFDVDKSSVLFVLLPGRSSADFPSELTGLHHYSLPDLSARSYEPLLRAIYDAPSQPTPALGSPPSFLTPSKVETADSNEPTAELVPLGEDEIAAAISLSELKARYLRETRQQSDERAAIVGAARESTNGQSFGALLSLASELGILEKFGLRVQIGNSYERLRFENLQPSGVRIHIETWDGNELSSVLWTGSAVEAFSSVTKELQKLNRFDSSFDAEESLTVAIDCLELQINLRTEGRQLGIETIVEPVRGPHPWVLTLAGIQSCEDGYSIVRERLDDQEFFWHVARKMWVDADQLWDARETAKKLFGENGPEYLREAIQPKS